MKKIYSLLAATLMAASVCAQEASHKYVKVETEPENWCGEYLIVYEGDDINNIANVFNGALEDLDVKGNFIQAGDAKQLVNGAEVRVIEASEEVDAATFTVTLSTETEGKYYIQSKSGYWIGYNSTDPDPTTGEIEPDLKASNTKQYDNSIALEAGKTSVVVTAKNGFELRFNADAGKERFRYHASGKKKAIKFYKKTEDTSTGITVMASESKSGVMRDLLGRQITEPAEGQIYIVNGKKYVK